MLLSLAGCLGVLGACSAFGGSDVAPDTSTLDSGNTGDAGNDGGGAATFDANVTSCVAPALDLVAWWAGDGNLNDQLKMSPGTSPAGTAYALGEVKQAFDLGGARYVQVASSTRLSITAALTIEAWIYSSTFGGSIVDKLDGFGGYALDTIKNHLRFHVGPATLSSTQALQPNVWLHVAGTYDGTAMSVYVNGVIDGTMNATPVAAASADLRIGADASGSGLFGGKIDEVALYARALTPQEIATIAAAGSFGRCKM